MDEKIKRSKQIEIKMLSKAMRKSADRSVKELREITNNEESRQRNETEYAISKLENESINTINNLRRKLGYYHSVKTKANRAENNKNHSNSSDKSNDNKEALKISGTCDERKVNTRNREDRIKRVSGTKATDESKTREKSQKRKRAYRIRKAVKRKKVLKLNSEKTAIKKQIIIKAALPVLIVLSALFTLLIIIPAGGVLSSPYAILLSSELKEDGNMSLKDAVKEINEDFQRQLAEAELSGGLNYCVIEGKKASWREVLSVYAVKYSKEYKDEVFSVTKEKTDEIKKVFWDMHSIDVSVQDRVPLDNAETEQTLPTLVINIRCMTTDEMAQYYSFGKSDIEMLHYLLKDEFVSKWTKLIYAVPGDAGIVETALSQLGEIGGEPYWSWWGYTSRVEWCAIFVSWCAEQCAYLDQGRIPKFENCQWGAQWFKENGMFAEKDIQPESGWIVFFDWGGDGICDHVGIVERYEDEYIFTVEGNSGDMCRQRSYEKVSSVIYGYGVPRNPG